MDPRQHVKQPWESQIFPFDCSEAIPESVTISSVTASIFDENGTDKGTQMLEGTPTISGTSVYVQVKGGTNGVRYNLRVRLTLSNGEKIEDDLTIYVEEEV